MEKEKLITTYEQSPITKISPLCRKDCKICNCIALERINELRLGGAEYQEIIDEIKANYKISISKSSLCRHFKNYFENLRNNANQKMQNNFDNQTDILVKNQLQAEFLADVLFNDIKSRMEAGTLKVEISDWEKIVKLRHSVLSGKSGAMDDLLAVFTQASQKYGLPISQSPLPLTSN